MNQPRFPPILVLTIGVLAVSFSAIFIRLAQDEQAVPSLAIATWRTTIATAILLPMALARRRDELARLHTADWLLATLSGIMLGLHFATWISSLAYTSITSSTVLVTTVPLWVGLAAPFVLQEPLTRPLKIGLVLALLGSLVIGLGDVLMLDNGRFTLTTTSSTGNNPMLGNGLALAGAVTSAIYYMIGRRLRQQFSLLTYTTVVYGMAAVTLILITVASQIPLFAYSPTAFLLFALMAIFPQLMGHSSFNWALGYLPAVFVSVAIISEPIGAGLLGILFLREIPGPLTAVGSVLILVGVFIASRNGNR